MNARCYDSTDWRVHQDTDFLGTNATSALD